CAYEYPSIHSIFNGKSPLGSFSSRKAPAPSDSIQRKNSLLKDKMGVSCSSAKVSISCWNISAFIHAEVRSEPVQTALLVCPDLTDRNPYFNAFIPEQQAPEGELISTFPFLRNPCTMAACDGNI